MMDKPATEGPTFSKMKSLYLGEWLVVDFYRPLAYFFNHAPNLAMLSLDQWKVQPWHMCHLLADLFV
jgi:hypothetical protein